MPPERKRATPDHYAILEVSPSATQEEIRASFRRLVLACHPDKNPDRKEWSEERVRQLIEAYEVLGDAARRATFDRWRRAAGKRPAEEPFFFRRTGPGARALLILHYLLHDRHDEAVHLLNEMEAIYGPLFLQENLESRDYLDSLFLLAEFHARHGEYTTALRRLRLFYLHERDARSPRHYFDEVVRRLKDLYLRRLPRVLPPADLVRYLEEAAGLELTRQEEIIRLKRLAEAQTRLGEFQRARQNIARILALDPGTGGLEKIQERLVEAGN